MRATPPVARMSDGTRSSAITATAPASSAMRACSGVTTSMMTPPLSIWARPFLVAQVEVSVMVVGLSERTREWSAGQACRGVVARSNRFGPTSRARLSHGARELRRRGGSEPARRPRSRCREGAQRRPHLADQRPDHPGHQRRRAARGRRREAAERLDEAQHVLVREARRGGGSGAGSCRRGPRPGGGPPARARWARRRLDQSHGAVEQPDEDQERGQPVAQADELRLAGVLGEGGWSCRPASARARR